MQACSCAQARVSVFVDMWHDADILCGLVWLCKCVWLKKTTWLGGKNLDSGTLPVSPAPPQSQPCYLWLTLSS